jgi:peptide/nickel transport system ATP-binding protein
VEKNNRSLFMITHDLDVVRAMQGTLAVMYAGQFMEIGPVRAILESRPYHPYTAGLLRSHPGNGMHPLPGKPPGLYDPRFGCRFANRCPGADAICTDRVPCLQRIAADHWVRCFHA